MMKATICHSAKPMTWTMMAAAATNCEPHFASRVRVAPNMGPWEWSTQNPVWTPLLAMVEVEVEEIRCRKHDGRYITCIPSLNSVHAETVVNAVMAKRMLRRSSGTREFRSLVPDRETRPSAPAPRTNLMLCLGLTTI